MKKVSLDPMYVKANICGDVDNLLHDVQCMLSQYDLTRDVLLSPILPHRSCIQLS